MDVLDLNKAAVQGEAFIQVVITLYLYKTCTVPTAWKSLVADDIRGQECQLGRLFQHEYKDMQVCRQDSYYV